MTASNEKDNINNNNNKEDIVEKITDDINNININKDENNNNKNTCTTTESTESTESTATTTTISITTESTTTTTTITDDSNTSYTKLSAEMAAKLSNLTTPDGKPKIIAYTTKLDSTSFYDEIDIEDMEFNEDERVFFYPCPCGDRFRITEEEILAGEEIAICPSCSLLLKVIYSPEDFIIEEEEN